MPAKSQRGGTQTERLTNIANVSASRTRGTLLRTELQEPNWRTIS
jgi:hypothetical protein